MGLVRWALAGLITTSTRGFPKGARLMRYAMYQRLGAFATQLAHTGRRRVLSVSGSSGLCDVLGFRGPEVELVETEFPAVSLLELPFPSESFDCVASDQVLEHVAGDPATAVAESFRVLKPGGIAAHTTCFINPIHLHPHDYWRFTPAGLRLLCAGHGRVLLAGGWGNPYVWPLVGLGLRFLHIPHAPWHPVHKLAVRDHPEWPVVTWVIARKGVG
jgi:SAM-dependent methyltransferase